MKLTRSLLAKAHCLRKRGSFGSCFQIRAGTIVMTECSSALIFISSSNQNCLIEAAGSASPFVSTTMRLTPVLATMYSTAATRSFLGYEENTWQSNRCSRWAAIGKSWRACLFHPLLMVAKCPSLLLRTNSESLRTSPMRCPRCA